MANVKQDPSQPKDYRLIVAKDVWIPLRDGTTLCADIFRPDGGDERFPVIMNIGPYHKDKLWVPPPDLAEKPNPYMNWETANPLWWCPRGYALLRVDTRGSGKSPGKSEPSSYQVAVDCYDCIEWVAKRPWCNGSVGTMGVSYHAAFQWRVAGLQPPSLKAILPWEGRADQYRDQAYHGGIFAMGFIARWHNNNTAFHLLGKPRSYNPDAFQNDMLWNTMRHSLDSEYWRKNSARWDKITVPVFSAGNWGGFAMHLRGNTEAYLCAASKHKKLRIHSGSHFHPFHSEEARLDQLRWFDYWLKGIDSGIMDEPPVKLEIRTGGSKQPYAFRFEDDTDIFATLRNIGPDGKNLLEVGQQEEPLQCVTKGWLRASHRKLDPDKSLPYRPYHAHNERQWLRPGEVVECQVEIWPTSMVFKKGHKLRLDISPADGVGTQHFTHFHADCEVMTCFSSV